MEWAEEEREMTREEKEREKAREEEEREQAMEGEGTGERLQCVELVQHVEGKGSRQ